MAEALRQQLAKAGRQAMAIHQGLGLGTQGQGRKRKPASEEQLSESDACGLTKKKQSKKNDSEGKKKKKNESEKEKERKRRQRREVKGKDKMSESEEETVEREEEKRRRERQADNEREEEEMALMLALAVPDVESDPVSPEQRAVEEEQEQTPHMREAEMERRLQEDIEMIQRLKQELDQARADAEAAQRELREEQRCDSQPEALAVAANEAAEGGVGRRDDGGEAMPMEWNTEVLEGSDLPSVTELENISDLLAIAGLPSIPPPTTTWPPSFRPSSLSSSFSPPSHASPSPGAASLPHDVWPGGAPPMAWRNDVARTTDGLGNRSHRDVGHTHSPGSPLTATASPHYNHQLQPTTPGEAPVRRVDVLLPLRAHPPSDQIRWHRAGFLLADDQETVASLRLRALTRWHLFHAEALGEASSSQEEAEAARAAAQAAAHVEQEDWELNGGDAAALRDTEANVWAVLQFLGPTSSLRLQRK